MLQSLLHLRIHAALQEIEHTGVAPDRLPVSRGEELVEIGEEVQESTKNENATQSENEEDFFDAEEDCANLCRQDSNSSFDVISDFSDEA